TGVPQTVYPPENRRQTGLVRFHLKLENIVFVRPFPGSFPNRRMSAGWCGNRKFSRFSHPSSVFLYSTTIATVCKPPGFRGGPLAPGRKTVYSRKGLML